MFKIYITKNSSFNDLVKCCFYYFVNVQDYVFNAHQTNYDDIKQLLIFIISYVLFSIIYIWYNLYFNTFAPTCTIDGTNMGVSSSDV